jgi:PAS domain S-box-containing protein
MSAGQQYEDSPSLNEENVLSGDGKGNGKGNGSGNGNGNGNGNSGKVFGPEARERRSTEEELRADVNELLQLSSLNICLSRAMVKAGTVKEFLQGCTDAIVLNLNVALSAIWTVDQHEKFLVLEASSGRWSLGRRYRQIEIGHGTLGLIASGQQPFVGSYLPEDMKFKGGRRASSQKIEAFVGQPILIGGRLRGVLAVFDCHPFGTRAFGGVAAIADQVALGIEHKNKEFCANRLAAVVQDSDDAIVSVGLDCRIQQWNRGAEQTFGFTAEEAIGRPMFIYAPPGRDNEMKEIFDRVLSGHHIVHYETQRKRKDGTMVDLSISVAGVRDSSGRITGVSAILREITAMKAAEESARQLLLMQEREDFMFTLTHDLKNPLIGANRVLAQIAEGDFGAIAAEPAGVLLKLRDGNNAIINLIQNIVEVYRFEKDTRSLDLQELDLRLFLEDFCSQFVPPAGSRHIQIKKCLPAGLSPINADLNSMRRLLHNLLDNAVKFSPEGGTVTVTLTCNSNSANLEIHNTGECIAPEERKLLFQRFFQGRRGKKYVAGSGLGLYLCHKIVSAHGGTINYCGNADAGSTFCVSLPLARG